MIRRKQFNDRYWRYYLMLEDKFIMTCRYVELTPENYSSFSDEFASLLMAIGAEIDALFKLNCGIDIGARSNIENYVALLPELQNLEIEIINREIDNLKPFEFWDKDKPGQSLEWWQAYNSIKHERGDNRNKASQKNVLYSLAALCLLENLMLRKISKEYGCKDVPSEYSKLFYIVGWKYNSTTFSKNEKDLYFELDENDEKDRELIETFKILGWDDSLIDIPEE